ncbi:DUF1015 family protein [Kineococcus gynurae]|uniref:DUF1015 family protein n=1 Tax=Kineococcus gynurae TaxID=452979 RepID=A0ABV5LY08_9ACTN
MGEQRTQSPVLPVEAATLVGPAPDAPHHLPMPPVPGALLMPFSGVRYDPEVVGDVGALLAPPHTELSQSERAHRMEASPYAVTRLERPENSPGPGPGILRWLHAGAVREDRPGFYVVRQRQQDRLHAFLLAALRVGPATDHRIQAHEATMGDVVVNRAGRLSATRVDSEPVLLLDETAGLAGDAVLAPERWGRRVLQTRTPDAEPVDVEVWHISDAERCGALMQDLAPRRPLIADGHHRYAAARHLAGQGENRLLVALAIQEATPVDVLSLHRVAPLRAADALRAHADSVRPLLDETDPVVAQLSLDTAEVILATREGSQVLRIPAHHITGAAAWTDGVLHACGVENRQVRYVPDVAASLRSVSGHHLTVLLPPTALPEIRAVLAEGHLLSRKSTSFRPKPLAGPVLRLR